MKIGYLFTSAMVLALSGLSPALSDSPSSNASDQNTKEAAAYFEQELAYTTNPYGVKLATEGKRAKINIVDVRSAEAFAKGHIPGAINIPFENFDEDQTDIPGLKKDEYNVVYCYTELCNLAQKASLKFAKLGYPVKEMKGGFEGWEEHKYPVEK